MAYTSWMSGRPSELRRSWWAGVGLLFAAQLVRRPMRAVLSMTGLAVSVGIMCAVGLLQVSLVDSVRLGATVSDRVDLVVSSAGEFSLSDDMINRIENDQRVKIAGSVIRSRVVAGSGDALLIGASDKAGPLTALVADPECSQEIGRSAVAFAAGAAFVGTGVEIDEATQTVSVRPTNGSRVALPVAGRLTCAAGQRVNGGAFVVGTNAMAKRILGTRYVGNLFLVDLVDGTDAEQVRSQWQSEFGLAASVATPKELSGKAERALLPYQQALLVTSILTMLVAGFLALNNASVSVLARRREFATMRAIGAPARRVVTGMLTEMAVIGTIAGVVGAGLGVVAASVMIRRLPQFITEAGGVYPTLSISWAVMGVCALAGLLTALIAGFVPTRQVARTQIVAYLNRDGAAALAAPIGIKSGEFWVAIGLAFASGVCAFLGADAEIVGVMLLFGAVLLATHAVSVPLAAVGARLCSMSGRIGRIAALSVGRSSQRFWSTMSAVMLAIALIVLTNGLVGDQISTFQSGWSAVRNVDLFIQTADLGAAPTGVRMQSSVIDVARSVPGVNAVAAAVFAEQPIGPIVPTVNAVDEGSQWPVLTRVTAHSRQELLAGNGVVITRPVANALNLEVGSTIEIPSRSGVQRTTVLEIPDILYPGDGLIGMSRQLFNHWNGDVGVSWLEVGTGGANPAVFAQVQQAVSAATDVQAYFHTGAEQLEGSQSSVEKSAAMFEVMSVVVFLGAVLGVMNTMMVTVIERTRELGVFRALGTDRATVRRSILVETLSVSVFGLLLGAPLGVLFNATAARVLVKLSGLSLEHELSLRPLAVAVVATILISLVAWIVAGRRATAQSIPHAISYE